MSSTREVAERLFDEPLLDNARYADFDVREWHVSRIDAALRQREQEVRAEVIPMVLYCPRCGEQHIDQEESETVFRHRMEAWALVAEPQDHHPSRWTNPPHKSHLCHNCGIIWRPADVATTGVASIETRGKKDSWPQEASEYTEYVRVDLLQQPVSAAFEAIADGFGYSVLSDLARVIDEVGLDELKRRLQQPVTSERCVECSNGYYVNGICNRCGDSRHETLGQLAAATGVGEGEQR